MNSGNKCQENRLLIEVMIDGNPLITLIDTGAQVTLISEAKILEMYKNKKLKMGKGIPIRGITGDITQTIGQVDLYIRNKKIKAQVIKMQSHDLLLGYDSLVALDARINIGSNKIMLNNYEYESIKFPANVCECIYDAKTPVSIVDEIIKEFPDVFKEEKILSTTHITECDIDTGNHKPIKQRAYRTPLQKRKVIEEELDKMLESGVIEPSNSNWSSPVTVQPKKDGTNRFCIDFRRINEITADEITVLPRIQDIFDSLGRKKFFTTIDLKSAYWQIKLTPRSKKKTAFICHRGLFQFTRMPFGIKLAPSIFQNAMSKLLRKQIGKTCFVYLDDIIIYSETFEDHVKHVKEILTLLNEANLKVKKTKCAWFQNKVELLGFVISENGIESDQKKVSAIRNLQSPRTIKQLRSFLGSTNYFRSLIPKYAQRTAPLNELLKKNRKFTWTETEENAFNDLKDALTNAPVLMYPDTAKPYFLYTDASDNAIGALLTQKDDAGLERPIQYISKSLASCQKQWSTVKKEAFSILHALNELHAYLYGSKFTIYTDSKACMAMFQKHVKNKKMERWALQQRYYPDEKTSKLWLVKEC